MSIALTASNLVNDVVFLEEVLGKDLSPEEVEHAVSICDRLVPAMQIIRNALLVNNGVSGEYNLALGQIKCHKHEPISA